MPGEPVYGKAQTENRGEGDSSRRAASGAPLRALAPPRARGQGFLAGPFFFKAAGAENGL